MTDHSSETKIPGHDAIIALREGLGDIEKLVTQHRQEGFANLKRLITQRQGTDELVEELSEHVSGMEDLLADLEEELMAQVLERNELAALYDVSQAIGSSLDLSEVLNEVMEQIIRLTGAERSLLMLVDPETDKLKLQAARNVDQEAIDSSSFEISRSIVNQVAETGEPIVTTNAQMDPRFKEKESVVGYKLRSILCVPLKARGQVTGVIYADNRILSGIFSERDLDLLTAFASQAAISLENARLFEDLSTANRKLARLDQAKSDFIDIASHELRTPLTQVRGYNDILGEMVQCGTLTPENAQQMTEGVRRAAQRLEEIVDTMFDVSQLDTKTLDLSKIPVMIAAVVNVAVEEWSDAMEERNQTITVENLRELPIIKGDGERLRQAFSQLIQNAIKYTPDGGHIHITGRMHGADSPDNEKAVEIIVSDTGIGIAAEDLERIFEKFYRVGDVLLHSTGKTKFKGAGPGLGLAIARGIVEGHGGRIWAESPGHDEETLPGSKFHVFLPVGQSSSAETTDSVPQSPQAQ